MNKSAAEGVMMVGKEEAPREEDGQVISQQHHSMVIYSHQPKPIVVEAQNFQTLVQSLTGGKRKRKAATVDPEGGIEDEGEVLDQAAASLQQQQQQQPGAKGQAQTLLEYLDRLDQECVPPSRSRANRGFFPTAGLVKGVNIEEGLQQFDGPESPRGPLNASPALDDDEQESPAKVRSIATIFTPLQCVPRCKLVCSEWAPEWSGCLSPRSLQVIKHAKRTALWAASGDRPGSGPWTISLEKIADVDRSSSEAEEGGMPVDILYYKAEVTIVGQTE